MDGNGRWARRRGVPRILGHRAGREAVRDTVRGAVALGVEVLTLYTFSTENWDRPKTEVRALMAFLKRVLREEVKDLDSQNVRLRVIGRTRDLSPDVRDVVDHSVARLAKNDGLLLVLALSYSGRAEILDAVRRLVAEAGSRPVTPLKVDEHVSSPTCRPPGCPTPTCSSAPAESADLELPAVAARLHRAGVRRRAVARPPAQEPVPRGSDFQAANAASASSTEWRVPAHRSQAPAVVLSVVLFVPLLVWLAFLAASGSRRWSRSRSCSACASSIA